MTARSGKDSRPRSQPVLTPSPSTPETKQPLGRLHPRSSGGRARGAAARGERRPRHPARPHSPARHPAGGRPRASPGSPGKPWAPAAPSAEERWGLGLPVSPRGGDAAPARTPPRGPGRRPSCGGHGFASRFDQVLDAEPSCPPEPPPGHGLPPAGGSRAPPCHRPDTAQGRGSPGCRGAALSSGQPPAPAQQTPPDRQRRGKAWPAGGAGGSQAHKAALCPGRAAGEPRRGPPSFSPGRAGGDHRQARAGEGRWGGRKGEPRARPGWLSSPAARPRGATARRCEKPPGAGVARATRTKRQHGGARGWGGGGEERCGSWAPAGSQGSARPGRRGAGAGGPGRGQAGETHRNMVTHWRL